MFLGHWGSRGTGHLGRQGAWLTVQAGSELWWLDSPCSAPSYAHRVVPAGTLGVLLQTLISRLYQEEQVFQAPLTVLLGVHPSPQELPMQGCLTHTLTLTLTKLLTGVDKLVFMVK